MNLKEKFNTSLISSERLFCNYYAWIAAFNAAQLQQMMVRV
jgi:hypothetical protein